MRSGPQFSCFRVWFRVAAAALSLTACAALLPAQNPASASSTTIVSNLPAPQDQTAADAPPTFTLRGTVVNRITHQPVPRALVQFWDKALLTDADGRFEFAGFPSTGVPLQVKKPGYIDPNTQGQPNETWQQGIVVGPNTPDLTLTITPEAVIAGHLSAPNSDQAEGFNVALYRKILQDGRPAWVQAGGVSSNSRGAFRFADLPAGTYYIATQAKLDLDSANALSTGGIAHGFPPLYSGTGTEFSSASEFALTAGQHLDLNLDLARRTFQQVTVSITNLQANAGVQPEIIDPSSHYGGYPVMYDAQKRVVRASLPNGTYTLRARVQAAGQPERLGQVSFVVSEKPLTALNLTLLPMGNIPVVVHREFVETPAEQNDQTELHTELQAPPLAGSIGGLQPSQENSSPEQRIVRQPPITMSLSAVDGSGPQGNLQPVPGAQEESLALSSVIPGRYWVQTQAIQAAYVASITSDGVDLMREPLVVGPGGASAPIEVTLRNDGATLKVNLAGSGDPAIAGLTMAFVYIVPDFDFSGPISQLVLLNRPGGSPVDGIPGGGPSSPYVFPSTVAGLAPGSYHVYTFATPHDLEYRNPEAMQAYSAQSQAVTLTAHETTSIEVNLPPPAE